MIIIIMMIIIIGEGIESGRAGTILHARVLCMGPRL